MCAWANCWCHFILSSLTCFPYSHHSVRQQRSQIPVGNTDFSVSHSMVWVAAAATMCDKQTCSSFLDVTVQNTWSPLERDLLQYSTKAELLYIAIPVCRLDIYRKPCCNYSRAPACLKRIRFGKETSSRKQEGLEIFTWVTQQTVVVD